MLEYVNSWIALKTDRRAVTAMEYGIIAGLIAVVIIAAVTATGTKLQGVFNALTTAI